MKELFASASFAGAALTMFCFFMGSAVKDKFKSQVFNPILIAIIMIITFLLTTGIDYDTYNSGAKYISWFLTPATVSLAIPLYRQIEQLKNNVFAILAGIFSGVVASAVGILTLQLCLAYHIPNMSPSCQKALHQLSVWVWQTRWAASPLSQYLSLLLRVFLAISQHQQC